MEPCSFKIMNSLTIFSAVGDSDWDTVTVLRKKTPKASTLKTESAINNARRSGQAVATEQKCK